MAWHGVGTNGAMVAYPRFAAGRGQAGRGWAGQGHQWCMKGSTYPVLPFFVSATYSS